MNDDDLHFQSLLQEIENLGETAEDPLAFAEEWGSEITSKSDQHHTITREDTATILQKSQAFLDEVLELIEETPSSTAVTKRAIFDSNPDCRRSQKDSVEVRSSHYFEEEFFDVGHDKEQEGDSRERLSAANTADVTADVHTAPNAPELFAKHNITVVDPGLAQFCDKHGLLSYMSTFIRSGFDSLQALQLLSTTDLEVMNIPESEHERIEALVNTIPQLLNASSSRQSVQPSLQSSNKSRSRGIHRPKIMRPPLLRKKKSNDATPQKPRQGNSFLLAGKEKQFLGIRVVDLRMPIFSCML